MAHGFSQVPLLTNVRNVLDPCHHDWQVQWKGVLLIACGFGSSINSPYETKRFTCLSTVSGITSSVVSPTETPASMYSIAIFEVSSLS